MTVKKGVGLALATIQLPTVVTTAETPTVFTCHTREEPLYLNIDSVLSLSNSRHKMSNHTGQEIGHGLEYLHHGNLQE